MSHPKGTDEAPAQQDGQQSWRAAVDSFGGAVNDEKHLKMSTAITCSACAASCCQLEVLLMGDDDVPRYLTREDRWGGTVMRRLDDGWCAALDRETRLCTIYQRRPGVCRDYEMGVGDCLVEFVRL